MAGVVYTLDCPCLAGLVYDELEPHWIDAGSAFVFTPHCTWEEQGPERGGDAKAPPLELPTLVECDGMEGMVAQLVDTRPAPEKRPPRPFADVLD